MTYEVYINGEKVKEYPFRIQAETYLHMRGYVSDGGRFGKWIGENVEIRERKEENEKTKKNKNLKM